MTLRKLPELQRPEAPNASYVLSEKAVQAWSPDLAPSAAADDTAVISILDVIGVDFWTGEGVTAKRVAGALRSIGTKPVIVQINSPGGSFYEGVAIYNLLRQHPAEITVQIIGMAASAAALIAMAGDRVEIGALAFMMTHNTQWVAAGDRHVMRETGDIMETFDGAMNAMFADRTGQSLETIAAWNDAEHWIAGQKAIDEGFADALLDADITQGESTAKNSAPALYRVEAALTRQGMPRAERRRLLKEITDGKPGAASDVKPRADDDRADDLDLSSLRLAAARMSLLRA